MTDSQPISEFEPGDSIEYYIPETKQWVTGVVHAVRKVDDIQGHPRVLTYLIDTGNDVRVDIHTRDLKVDFINQEIHKHIAKGASVEEARSRVSNIKNLPESKIVEDTVRQPEQEDVPPEFVRAKS